MEMVIHFLRLREHARELGAPGLLQVQACHLVFVLICHHLVEMANDGMRELVVPGADRRFTCRHLEHKVDVGRSVLHVLVVDEFANT